MVDCLGNRKMALWFYCNRFCFVLGNIDLVLYSNLCLMAPALFYRISCLEYTKCPAQDRHHSWSGEALHRGEDRRHIIIKLKYVKRTLPLKPVVHTRLVCYLTSASIRPANKYMEPKVVGTWDDNEVTVT